MLTERDRRIAELYRQTESGLDVAEALGMNHGSVYYSLKKQGIVTRGRGRPLKFQEPLVRFVRTRFTAAQWRDLERAAAAASLDVSEFVRESAVAACAAVNGRVPC